MKRKMKTIQIALAGLVLLAAGPPAVAQEETKPTLSIAAVTIEPPAPAADTLCQLRVRVKNAGAGIVSALFFGVAIGGEDLKVYEKQLFMERLDPGAVTEVRLYNFWTSESGRPAPKDGKLRLTVELREAQRLEITTEDDGAELWTLGDPVAGLPVSKEIVVKLK